MALHDPFSIVRPIEAKPYTTVPNIVIGYPSRPDWKNLYDPKPLRMPDDQGIYRNVDQLEARYQDMKRDHEKNVLKRLEEIRGFATGRAVFAEVSARSAYTVTIFPFDFLPVPTWNVKTLAATGPLVISPTPADLAAMRANPKVPAAPLVPQLAGIEKGERVCRGDFCFLATGTGTSVDMFYTPRRADDQTNKAADDVLLHELVHATRYARGVLSQNTPVGGGYENQEEFFGNTVQMIYRSERKRPIFDYVGNPLDPRTFLDKKLVPSPRVLLDKFRGQQQTFFDALLKIDAAFNPMRELDRQPV